MLFDRLAEDVRFVLSFLYGFGLGVMGEWFYFLLLVLFLLGVWAVLRWVEKLIRKL